MDAPRHVHLLFSGFRQRWSDPDNGMSLIYRTIRHRHPTSETLWYPWHVDAGDLADMICGYAAQLHPDPLKLTICGYSFGGSTAVDLCRRLYRRGGPVVSSLVLMDAVKRRSRAPWGWLAAWNQAARFNIPSNVLHTVAFYQRTNWPRGHRVRLEKPSVSSIEWIRLYEPHGAMDNHPLARDAALMGCERTYR